MVHNLSESDSVANQYVAELRDKGIQRDPLRFRSNMERLGHIMAYEISKELEYKDVFIETPLATAKAAVLREQPVLLTVLRAGLPYFDGFLTVFDRAESGFIGASRVEQGDEISIDLDYLAAPSLHNRIVILIDPMLATGKSYVQSINAFLKKGTPKKIYIAALVASPEGIEYIQKNVRVPHAIWTFVVDKELNDQSYIVPGLGDAGDLSFGLKI